MPPAVRDALALTRLLWIVESEGEADVDRMRELTEVGLALARGDAGAVDRLERLDWPDGVRELVQVAAERARGGPRRVEDLRTAKAASQRR